MSVRRGPRLVRLMRLYARAMKRGEYARARRLLMQAGLPPETAEEFVELERAA